MSSEKSRPRRWYKAFYKNPSSDWTPAHAGTNCTVDMNTNNGKHVYCREYDYYINANSAYLTILGPCTEENEFGEVCP